jgi:hypothetical protein
VAHMMSVTLACSFAFMLPISTPPNAIAFATKAITSRDMLSTGVWLNMAACLLCTLYTVAFFKSVYGCASAARVLQGRRDQCEEEGVESVASLAAARGAVAHCNLVMPVCNCAVAGTIRLSCRIGPRISPRSCPDGCPGTQEELHTIHVAGLFFSNVTYR